MAKQGDVYLSNEHEENPDAHHPAGGGTPYIIWGELVDNAVGMDKFRMLGGEWQNKETKTFDKLVVRTRFNLTAQGTWEFAVNAGAVGTVIIANGAKRGQIIVTNFDFDWEDNELTVEKKTGNDEGGVTQAYIIEAENTS